MISLGIESTAHTFGVAIVDDQGKVYSNKRDAFTTEQGGMIPFQVANHHLNIFESLIISALKEANFSLKDIDLISFSRSPGLGHTLRIGSLVAKFLSSFYNIDIVGVNHCIAHLEIGRILAKDDSGEVCEDPVLLYASGANTQIIAYASGKYRIFGESLDIGVGNFLDSLARYMGLGFPGGPKIYDLSLKFDPKKNKLIEIPYFVKGMDVGFGGILTFLKKKFDSKEFSSVEIAYSAQEYVFSMLLEVSERAMAHTGKDELLLGGGVACNVRLKEMSKIMCSDRDAKCFILENQYNVDNAAMIAWTGLLKYKSDGVDDLKNLNIDPYERTDDVVVGWRSD